MNTAKVIFGISAAFTTGALLGIMFAPESGYNTRKRMVQVGSDIANALNDRIDERFRDLTRAVQEKVSFREQKVGHEKVK